MVWLDYLFNVLVGRMSGLFDVVDDFLVYFL